MVVGALSPGEVGGEIFDVDLHPGPVSGEHVQGMPRTSQTTMVWSPSAVSTASILDSKSRWDRLHPAYQALAANLS